MRFAMDEATQTETMARLKEDLEAFDALRSRVEKTKKMQLMENRSVFQLTATQQFVMGAKVHDWKPHEEMTTLAHKKARVLNNTQCLEEFVGVAKNAKEVRGGKKCKRPERAMAKIIGRRRSAESRPPLAGRISWWEG